MNSSSTYKYITTAATTTLYGSEVRRVHIHAININKALTGAVTVKAGATTIGVFAAGTAAGCYWLSTYGIEVESCNIVNGSTEDITVIYTNIG